MDVQLRAAGQSRTTSEGRLMRFDLPSALASISSAGGDEAAALGEGRGVEGDEEEEEEEEEAGADDSSASMLGPAAAASCKLWG